MIKAFLSHSSADKARYVRVVAEKLGSGFSVYDEYTFEAGMQPLEEIVRELNESQLFVVFLSDSALASEWVQKELRLAHENLSKKLIERVFPIIIDPSVTYKDARVPHWVKDNYNLKYVSRPVVCARRIKQRLREISWDKNPRLKERNAIFVGRNDLISQIEVRVDDLDQVPPVCFVASGLPRIGRKSLLRHALIKCSIAKQSYEFPSVFLGRTDSLEDLLLKLYDLGFSDIDYPANLMNKSIEDRVRLIKLIVQDVIDAQELVVIHDDGCLVNHTGGFHPWFADLLAQLGVNERPVFLISSKYRLRPENARLLPYVFSISVPELTYQERNGLFKRLLDFEGLSISRDDFGFFSGLFQGFPDQLQFACNLIEDGGVAKAKSESHLITEFNSEKAATILSKHAENEDVLEFLYLLSEFEFISFEFLFSIVDETVYMPLVEQFLSETVCDYVGIEKEFIRLNDTIRDYVRRNRHEIPIRFQSKLKAHLNNFIESSDVEGRDVSDVLYSMKEGIKEGRVVPDIYLIPSHFLASMRELYQERGHLDRVIELADRLLEKKHLLERTVEQDVRYYLCLSLARKKEPRLLKEVQKVHGIEHQFLLGFYYRLQGRANDAIRCFEQCLKEPVVSNRAKRELVQVYLSIEDYEAVSVLARVNYENNRRNPYHIQAYLNTLVNSNDSGQHKDEVHRLIDELRLLQADVAVQMADIAQADYYAKCLHNYQAASDAIDDAVRKYPHEHYPLISKAYLAAHNGDSKRLMEAYNELEKQSQKRTISEESMGRLRAYKVALEGNLADAEHIASRSLARIPESARNSFMKKLREVANRFGKNAQQER